MALEPIRIVLEATDRGLDRVVGRAERRLDGFQGVTERASARLAALGSRMRRLGRRMSIFSAGVAAAGAGLLALAGNAAAAGNEIAKNSRAAGISAESYQELAFALGQITDMSGEQLGASLQMLNRRIGEAAQGTGEAVAAMKELGYTEEEIAAGTITTEQAMDRFVQKMGEVTSPAVAAALSTDLFGRAGAGLGPQLMGSVDQVKSLRDRAHELGIVLDQEALDSAEVFTDQLSELKQAFQALLIKIGAEFLPVLTKSLMPAIIDHVIPGLASMAEYIGDAIEWFGGLPVPVKKAAGAIAVAFAVGGPALIAIGALAAAFALLTAAGGPIMLLITLASVAAGVWAVWGDDMTGVVDSVGDHILRKFGELTVFFATLPARFRQKARAMGEEFMLGLIEIIDEKWEELKAKVYEVGQNIIQGLIDGIDEKWEAMKAKIYEMAESLPLWMREMLGIHSPSRVFMEIGQFIGEGLAQGIGSAEGMVEEAVGVLGEGAVSSTQSMVSGVLSSLGELFKGSKAIAAAQALVNTWAGATEALKLPFPKNLFAFAKVVATGLNAVRNIKSARPGSSGGTSASSGGGGGGAEAGAGVQEGPIEARLNLVGQGDYVRMSDLDGLLDGLNKTAGRRGYRLTMPVGA